MFEYSKVFADRATTHADSAQRLAQLARAYYFIGAYYGAVETQEKLTKLEPNNSKYRFGLATFRMMNGEYEQAHDDLIAAQSPDFNQGFIQFNLALNWLERGDSSKAKSILEELVTTGESVSLQGEARTLLGYILLKSKDSIVKQQARDHFNFAIGYFNQQIQTNPAVPSPYMWSGIAMLGLDDVENAIERLQLGLFLESRPFYFGMINLWLGKAADLKKEHELAKEYYSEVMAGESAAYHQEEARLHLEKAYTQ
jgi:tetratricopeptide (TPR) repeat protein